MKQDILMLGLGISAILLSVGQLHAQSAPRCAPRASVLEQLNTKYGEARQSVGLSANSQVMEVFASSESGTWTITITNPQGITCLVAAGRGYENVDEDLQPAVMGDPA